MMARISERFERLMGSRVLLLAPWWLLFLWRPDLAVDLNDKQGKADHGKRVGFLAFLVDAAILFLSIYRNHALSWQEVSMATLMNGVVFGWIGYRTFLASKSAPEGQ